MFKEKLSIQDVIDALNRMLVADPKAMRNLCSNRIECNASLANDEACQVASDIDMGKHFVGLLGVLNGIVGSSDKDGYGCIAAVYSLRCKKFIDHDVKGKTINELCPVCKSSIKMGDITGFKRVGGIDMEEKDEKQDEQNSGRAKARMKKITREAMITIRVHDDLVSCSLECAFLVFVGSGIPRCMFFGLDLKSNDGSALRCKPCLAEFVEK